tara:strand:+ start:445 stop:927 length:483 start_codon:yes stop_codon:yes gene_type:complete
MKLKLSRIHMIIVGLLVAVAVVWWYTNRMSGETISNLTDKWIKAVTVNKDPTEIYDLFCSDGNLVGTVSQKKRIGEDIKKYFNYFAKLPGLQVVEKEYNISRVTSNVYLNTAFITWKWDGLDEPITARMTFLYRDTCIFQLHSSALPDLNEDLLEVSNLA